MFALLINHEESKYNVSRPGNAMGWYRQDQAMVAMMSKEGPARTDDLAGKVEGANEGLKVA